MASHMFKLALRPTHERPEQEDDVDIGSNTLPASPIPIHSPTQSRASAHHAAKDDRTDKRRASFLTRRFSTLWAQKPENTTDDDVRGPLGLRLLFASPEPMIEIIFVHGLGGGSIKTWRKGNDPKLYWPQHWMPSEPEFRNASIHSFGYEADWKRLQPSILGVHDFGQALYEEMRLSSVLRRNPKSPIILVGHSMGGLVIKKAHILAHRNRSQCDISDRIRGIFFLATPHKGSDYAALLNNILRVSGAAGLSSSREYIEDLTIGSKSTQLINEEFGSCIASVPIFSFYETLRTNIGVSSAIIVDKDSAVLGPGYQNERVTYLNANHRNVCKFSDPSDPNYLTVKNALGSVVHGLLVDALAQTEKLASSNLLSIRSYLGANDYVEHHHDRLDGSCQWIDDREDYMDWRDAIPEQDKTKKYMPSFFWVTANPGAGKTVLVAHIESQLEEFGLQHGAYYFNFGKKESRSVAGLLRSLAYQMAQSNAAVRETLMKFHDEASTLDLDDVRAIWSRIFQTGIFQSYFRIHTLTQIPILTPQYWLIDALDECGAYPELFSLIKGTPIAFPLKIFITSRKLADMPKLLRQLKDLTVRVVEIPIQDTMRDIRLYISSRMPDLPVDSGEEATQLTNQLITKSNASFLWVRLVMDELEGVYGHESIVEVLQGIPEGMVSYYRRTVFEMAENRRERHIAKAILEWIALAARPLSIHELAHALSIDVKTQLSSPKTAVEGLCGHLVSIDAECDHVRIIHTTAREFLSSDDAGDFRISSAQAHEKIALVCLKLLCSPDMQPPRHRRNLEQKRLPVKAPALLDYAVSHFSDHIFSASASSDELLASLAKFLSSTSLTWIEKVAAKGDMHRLVGTARNLKAYLIQKSKYSSLPDRHAVCVDSWVTDLGRLATKFHSALSTYPQSIYFLIPPLCPTDSAIRRQFRQMPDSLALLGPKNQHWDDCVATLDFGNESVASISCGESLIAVGFESGDVAFYNNRSQETDLVLHNDLAIYRLQFDPQGLFIAGVSRRFLMVWDLQGNLLWKTRIRFRLLLLAFSPTYLLGVGQQGKAVKWDIETGELVDEHVFVYQPPDDGETSWSASSRAPCTAAVSPNLELVALAYRNGPVCLFDLESAELVGWALDALKRGPQYLIFHPNPDVNLLLVIYNESEMSLFDPWTGTLVKNHEPEVRIIPLSATCSPSGQTFATVDLWGTLRIWDFKSLAVLYHVLTPSPCFRMLQFTSDNFNLLDVTAHEMKFWSPMALMRKNVEEESSTSGQPEVVDVPEGHFRTLQMSPVTTLTAHPKHSVLFAGKDNGEVALYNMTDGREIGVLYTHQDSVMRITACRENVIASSDLSHTVQVWALTIRRSNMIQAEKLLFKTHPGSPIRQLLFDDSGEYLLVSTLQADIVYRTSNCMIVGSLAWPKERRNSWKWISMPNDSQVSTFALIQNRTLSQYTAPDFPRSSPTPQFRLDYSIDEGLEEIGVEAVFLQPSRKHLALQYSQGSANAAHSSVAVFQLPPADGGTSPFLSPIPVSPLFHSSTSTFKYALGFTSVDERLVFLDRDSWVCSVPITGDTSRYARHFFVPTEYTTKKKETVPIQGPGDTFLFCLFDTIAVIKNGLKFQELINVETP